MGKLEQTFSELVRVSSGEPEIVKSYGILYAHQAKIGKKVGENDLWVAATAVAINGTILTCDSDFLKFDPTLVSYIYFPV
jgi:predicted nucleic acid-binding protein